MNSIDVLKVVLNVFEAAACVSGFAYLHKVKRTDWQWFPAYLLFIITAELTAKYLTYKGYDGIKIFMYQYLVIPAEILFFLFMFKYEFKRTSAEKVPLIGMAMFIVSLVADSMVLNNKLQWFLSFSYAVGVLVLVINILIFLFRLASSNRVLYYRSNFVFWVCIGLLLFYLGTIPFQGIYVTLYNNHNASFRIFAYLIYAFDCFMYLSFIIAFVWGKLRSKDS